MCRSLVVHIRTLSFRPPKPCTLSLCIQESSVYRVAFHMVGIKFYKLAQGRRAAQPLSVRCIYCCNLQENIWYAPVNFTWTRKGNSCFVLRNKKKPKIIVSDALAVSDNNSNSIAVRPQILWQVWYMNLCIYWTVGNGVTTQQSHFSHGKKSVYFVCMSGVRT